MKTLKVLVAVSLLNALITIAVVATTHPTAPNISAPQTSTVPIGAGSALSTSPFPSPLTQKATPRVTPVPQTIKTSPAAPLQAPTTTPTQTPAPITTTPTPTPAPATPTPTPIVDKRCLIQIDGALYDVTQFRSRHSGGDIFQCGTDMSAIFWGEHGQKQWNQIQQYRI